MGNKTDNEGTGRKFDVDDDITFALPDSETENNDVIEISTLEDAEPNIALLHRDPEIVPFACLEKESGRLLAKHKW